MLHKSAAPSNKLDMGFSNMSYHRMKLDFMIGYYIMTFSKVNKLEKEVFKAV